jgi:hypothetical protein
MRFLSDAQQAELRGHLAKRLEPDHVEWMLGAIDTQSASAAVDISEGKARREVLASKAAHHGAILEHATALRVLLKIERPLTVGICPTVWDPLEATLWQIVGALRAHLEGTTPRPTRRGRKPEEWRDRLIALVFNLYPPGLAAKTADGHFEETIGMLLGYLGVEVNDVHSVVLDALARHPHLPTNALVFESL